MKIADLPFAERPVLELLDVAEYRDAPDHDYAGYGWARVPRLCLVENDDGARYPQASSRRAIDDALVIAVHTADDGPASADDLELEFDTPDRPVAVMASKFLAIWLPRLPAAKAIVLCVCNPHRATMVRVGDQPMWLPMGDVHSWRDHDNGDILLVAESWSAR